MLPYGSVMMARRACLAGALVVASVFSSVHEGRAQNHAAHSPTRSETITRPRVAVVILALRAQTDGRAVTARSDADAVSRRLREIGFDIRMIEPARRPEMIRTLRDVTSGIAPGTDVAVIVLGQTLGSEDDLFILPDSVPVDLTDRPHLLDTEAVRLGDVVRRFGERGPAHLVTIVDECRPLAGASCPLDGAAGSSRASIVAAERRNARGGDGRGPMAALPSLREPLLGAWEIEGQNVLQFYETLQASLSRTDMTAVAGSLLSSSFQFLPAGYFRGLGTACNRIDASADAATIRGLQLDEPLRACQRGLATYPYARFFREQTASGMEQQAFQRAVAGCDRVAVSSYRASYPSGRFRGLVDEVASDCERQERRREEDRRQNEARRQADEEEAAYRRAVLGCADRRDALAFGVRYPGSRYRSAVDTFLRTCDADEQRQAELRQREAERRDLERREAERREQERLEEERRRSTQRVTISSRTGWFATYATNLLRLDPSDDDNVNAMGLITTYLKPTSLYDGKVDFFIQTGENKECQQADAWARRVLTRNRPSIQVQQFITAGGERAFFQEGSSFKRDPGVSFMDMIIIPSRDPNMFIHAGVQFPAADRAKWRDEFVRLLQSFRISPTGAFRGRCG